MSIVASCQFIDGQSRSKRRRLFREIRRRDGQKVGQFPIFRSLVLSLGMETHKIIQR